MLLHNDALYWPSATVHFIKLDVYSSILGSQSYFCDWLFMMDNFYSLGNDHSFLIEITQLDNIIGCNVIGEIWLGEKPATDRKSCFRLFDRSTNFDQSPDICSFKSMHMPKQSNMQNQSQKSDRSLKMLVWKLTFTRLVS